MLLEINCSASSFVRAFLRGKLYTMDLLFIIFVILDDYNLLVQLILKVIYCLLSVASCTKLINVSLEFIPMFVWIMMFSFKKRAKTILKLQN
jgi:hypothetical protein